MARWSRTCRSSRVAARLARPAAICALALALAQALALPEPARAEDRGRGAERESAVGLHLATGGLLSDAGKGVMFDLGLRLRSVLLVGSWRHVAPGAGGTADHLGGRLDWFIVRNGWVGVHAGLGGGGLRLHAPGETVTVPALSGGVELLLGELAGFGLVGVGAEFLAPLTRIRFDTASHPAAPTALLTISVNPLLLLLK